MKKLVLLSMFVLPVWGYCFSQSTTTTSAKHQEIYAAIKRLMDFEIKLVLSQDTGAMNRFYPDDMAVTNPFNQFIGKRKVLERVKSDIIKYSSYEKTIEHFHIEGDKTVVVIGSELVVPTPDANRTDAGKTINRRFTEVWMKRGNDWKKVIRHANNVVE